MFDKLLIANRGAIACRILRTLRNLNVNGVAVYSEADAASLHLQQADEAHSLGEGPATQTYLDVEKILRIARETGAKAIHPGYGFLSENAAFAEACEAAGIARRPDAGTAAGVWPQAHRPRLGQTTRRTNAGGHRAARQPRRCPRRSRAGRLPGDAEKHRRWWWYRMRVCRSAAELTDAFDAVKRLGQNNFSDSGVFIEKYIERARHRGAGVRRRRRRSHRLGRARLLGTAAQPEGAGGNPGAEPADRHGRGPVRGGNHPAKAVSYRSAGTVEFVYDAEAQRFYFLEVNTRLQVEHGVTEQVWGVDLVRWMIELAAGDLPPLAELVKSLKPSGHSIRARVYAEDPGRDFQPSPGLLTAASFLQPTAKPCVSTLGRGWLRDPAIFRPDDRQGHQLGAEP